jgi:hypothetical protein
MTRRKEKERRRKGERAERDEKGMVDKPQCCE